MPSVSFFLSCLLLSCVSSDHTLTRLSTNISPDAHSTSLSSTTSDYVSSDTYHHSLEESDQKRTNYIIEGPIFRVSYNEVLEQPNWIEYTVRNVRAVYDRKDLNFYEVDSVHTSDDADYYRNIWDKGHLAPAYSFSDTKKNLIDTFSYLNCALQHQSLNRGQWAALEKDIRARASRHQTDVCVRVELLFSKNSRRLSTGAVVPDGFIKQIYIKGVGSKCYKFENKKPLTSWKNHQVKCNTEISCFKAK